MNCSDLDSSRISWKVFTILKTPPTSRRPCWGAVLLDPWENPRKWKFVEREFLFSCWVMSNLSNFFTCSSRCYTRICCSWSAWETLPKCWTGVVPISKTQFPECSWTGPWRSFLVFGLGLTSGPMLGLVVAIFFSMIAVVVNVVRHFLVPHSTLG